MKKIELKQIKLRNFKGLKKFEASFTHNTNIYGDNATGKTTIMDAFLWLLFGKDSTDRKEFEIKTISFNGNGTPKEVEVEAELAVDKEILTLKRVFKERWVKKRGAVDVEFAGHQTDYFINGVPTTQKEYNDHIGEVLSEEFFKIITNPMYFSSLPWKQQREMLFDMVPAVSDKDIATGNEMFEELMGKLVGKDLDGYRKEVLASKKKIKEQLENIPARIDEVELSMPKEEDWKELEKNIKENSKEIESIEVQIKDKSKAYEKQYAEKEKVLFQLQEAKKKLRDISEEGEASHREHLAKAKRKRIELAERISAIRQHIGLKHSDANRAQEMIHQKQKDLETLRGSYRAWGQKELVIDESDLNCPACKRPLDDIEEKREKLVADFNTTKAERLDKIDTQGRTTKEEITILKMAFDAHSKEAGELQTKLSELEKVEIPDPVFNGTKKAETEKVLKIIDELQAEYDKPIKEADTGELYREKNELQAENDKLKEILTKKERIKEAKERIKELEKMQKDLAQQQADYEREEYAIAEFEKAKVQSIEKQVNGLFSLVEWTLFETQINGQEVPTCKATYKGVPYSDLNTAMKINAGIDIINAISKDTGVSAPIFIDHAESVTKLENTDSQLIRLIVSEEHKVLTIN